MALINCPESECGNMVSSSAEFCPRCGHKLEAQNTSELSKGRSSSVYVGPSGPRKKIALNEASNEGLTGHREKFEADDDSDVGPRGPRRKVDPSIGEQRRNQLSKLFGTKIFFGLNKEYPDSSVSICEPDCISILVKTGDCTDWVESIDFTCSAISTNDYTAIARFNKLKSIDFQFLEDSGDQMLYCLSNCASLRKLKLPMVMSRATLRGWASICKLKSLRIVELPSIIGGIDTLQHTEFLSKLRKHLPNTSIK